MASREPIDPRRLEAPDPEMVRALKEKSGAERWRIATGMVAAARRMLRSSLGAKHPEWDDEALEREVARRIAGGD